MQSTLINTVTSGMRVRRNCALVRARAAVCVRAIACVCGRARGYPWEPSGTWVILIYAKGDRKYDVDRNMFIFFIIMSVRSLVPAQMWAG